MDEIPNKEEDSSTNVTKVPNTTTNEVNQIYETVESTSTNQLPDSVMEKIISDQTPNADISKEDSNNQATKVPNNNTIDENITNNQVPIFKSCDNNEDKKDVEKFGGKIVYNPDGSAYIIEDGDLSEEEALSVPLPTHEGSIVEKRNQDHHHQDGEGPAYPLIANAIYVTRSAAYYNALYGQAYAKILRDKMAMPEAPIVHSYKVYSLSEVAKEASKTSIQAEKEPPLVEYSTVPVKPILMCFVCKLSFGLASSFHSHCTEEHNIQLTEKEKSILDAKNSSALIQLVGKDKEPVLSFLEPVVKKVATPNLPEKDQVLSPNAIKGLLSAALTQQKSTPVGFPTPGIGMPCGETGGPSSRGLFPPLDNNQIPVSSFLPNLPSFLANAVSASAAAGSSNTLFENLTSAALLRNSIESLARKSPQGLEGANNGRSSVSPASMAPLPLNLQSLAASMNNDGNMQGTTIGACPEHINGRQTGVECSNCDMIMNSSRMPGGITWNTTRNSCKTLKCPKCNWHYKYQETLEIHMKEKHPDNDSTCIYCITGQQHPRLARGETYTCGYKPYRCEVCNYSTTTKGNLSIHTQSDKHLNNMQELQKGGVVTSPDGTKVSKPHPMSHPGLLGNPLAALVNQKPNWRCDVCNYETNVARNLRIHMTSEKHTHNMMVLQQNVKHMQQLGTGAGAGGPQGPPPGGLFPSLPGMDPQQLLQMQFGGPGGMPCGLPMSDKPGQNEAAMADMAYLQALMMQMLTGGQFPPGPHPSEFNQSPGGGGGGGGGGGNGGGNSMIDNGLSPEAMEPPPEPAEPNPKFLFNCCVCKEFGCDALEVMSHHLTLDRTKFGEEEVSVIIAGNSICKLCNYKTNLKANFQLHCKTDKHMQRLNHVNHIKEGGPPNEWKLKFLNVTNPVQLRCNACDYYTNSLHKLQLHVSNQRHEISNILFGHLKNSEATIHEDRRSYNCILCKFTSNGKMPLMNHVRSMKHLQMEQIHQLQKRSEGNMEQTEIGDIFQVVDSSSSDEQPGKNSEMPAEGRNH
jgi:AT-binding transcription factor 1